MKKSYIELAKKYLALHPEYLEDPEKLFFQMKLIGIPEKDINRTIADVLKESGQPTSPPHQASPIPHEVSLTKWYVVLYFIALVGMLLFIFFFPIPNKKRTISYVIPTPPPQAQHYLPQIPSGGLIKQVYANELPVKMQQVFSYPVQNITIAPSVRPKREVVGFIPYWDIDTLDKLNISELTSVNLFGIEPDGDGNIIITDTHGQADGGWAMWNDARLGPFISLLKQKQIRVALTVKVFSNAHMETLLASTDAQKKLISNILYMVSSKNLDGVNIDFEYTGNNSLMLRDEFTSFMTTLGSALKNEFPSSALTIDTYASSGVTQDMFDLTTLASVINAFIIMGYDFHTPYTDPGPVAPLIGEKSIVSYLANYLQKVTPDKIILAVPYYGYDWIANAPAPSSTAIVGYADIIGANGLNNFQWDTLSETPWYQYTDTQGNLHKVYFDNIRSLGLKYDLVNTRNLKGIGIWAVGYEGQNTQIDQLISQKFGY